MHPENMNKLLIACTAILLVLAAGCQTSSEQPSAKLEESVAQPEPPKTDIAGDSAYVAVSDFSVLSSDENLKYLATEIPNRLTEAFTKGGAVKPVERRELENVMEELKLSMSGLTEEAYSVEAGKLLGANYILVGSLSKLETQARISCRLIETETARIVYTESARGMFSDLYDIEDELAGKIEEYFRK